MSPANREGFSLLEVLMATSILLGSVIVLNQLAGIGRKNALAAQDLSTAQMLCQTRLNEILAGTVPAEPVDEEPFPGAPGWVFTVNIEPVDPALTVEGANLSALELTVSREEPDRDDRSRYTLVRWIENAGPGPICRHWHKARTKPGPSHNRRAVVMRRARRRPATLPSKQRNAGFTLLEVLLTAILSATLLAGLWSLFGTYLRLFESGQARVERAQLLRALTRQMSDDLHGVVATNGTSIKPGGGSPNEGRTFTSDRFEPASESGPGAGSKVASAGADAREDVPRFCLVGNRTMMRLEVLQPTSPLDSAQPAEATTARLGEPGALRPNATELRAILYSFEPPREVSESDREAPPGLLRRELTWEAMQAAASGAGARGSSSQSAEQAVLARGFAPLTATEAREVDQFDDSVIWTPEVVALRFRYFDGQAWSDQWDSRQLQGLPAAVEIAMRLQPADGSQEPAQNHTGLPEGESSTTDRQENDSINEINDDLLASDDSATAASGDESGLPIVRQLVVLQAPARSRDKSEERPASFFADASEEQKP